MTNKIWADFAKNEHKIDILQYKINEDWHFFSLEPPNPYAILWTLDLP